MAQRRRKDIVALKEAFFGAASNVQTHFTRNLISSSSDRNNAEIKLAFNFDFCQGVMGPVSLYDSQSRSVWGASSETEMLHGGE